MHKILIRFTRPRSKLDLMAWAVRLLTWAPYSHAALQFNNKIFHAVKEGSVWTDFADFDKRHETIAMFEVSLDDLLRSKLLAIANKLEKIPYDWLGVVGIALHKMFGLRRNILRTGKKAIFCSELCYYLLVMIGVIKASEAFDPELFDPKKLLRYLEKSSSPNLKRLK